MKTGYFIEILSRNGEVQHRHHVPDLPIRIGRAYDNDVILDDVHTAAHHAIVDVDAEGALLISDQGSRNGLIHQNKRQRQVSMTGHSVVRLGQTNLRIRSADFAVDEEAFDTSNYNWEGWRPALTGILMIGVMAFTSIRFGDVDKFDTVRYLMSMAGIFAVGLVWSGIWTFANRLFGGHGRFGRHLFIAACGMVTLEIFGYINSLLAFAFSWEIFTRYGEHLLIFIGAATVYFHLTTINPRASRRAMYAATIVALIGSGFLFMTNYQRSGTLAAEFYMNDQFHPAIRLSKNQSLDQFMSNTEKLKTEVDAQRSKAVNPGGDGEED